MKNRIIDETELSGLELKAIEEFSHVDRQLVDALNDDLQRRIEAEAEEYDDEYPVDRFGDEVEFEWESPDFSFQAFITYEFACELAFFDNSGEEDFRLPEYETRSVEGSVKEITISYEDPESGDEVELPMDGLEGFMEQLEGAFYCDF